jgi:hypothetical protein
LQEQLLEPLRPVQAQECALFGLAMSYQLAQSWVEVQVEHKGTMYPYLMSMMQHKTILLETPVLTETRQTGKIARFGDLGSAASSMERGAARASIDFVILRGHQDDVFQALQRHRRQEEWC